MPTSQEEAKKILAITHQYIPLSHIAELFTRLDSEVGQHTDNDSLKQSLGMMREFVTAAKDALGLRYAFIQATSEDANVSVVYEMGKWKVNHDIDSGEWKEIEPPPQAVMDYLKSVVGVKT